LKTKVKVVFPADPPGRPGWPYIDYDVDSKSAQVLADLREQLPEIEFSSSIVRSIKEAEKLVEKKDGEYDGTLVYMTAMWTRIEQVFASRSRPVVIADDLYAGSGGILSADAFVTREGLPVVTIASSDFGDVVDAVNLFDVMRKMREARILVVSDNDRLSDEDETIEPFGTTVITMRSDRLMELYEAADPDEAERQSKIWKREALEVVEPDDEELLRSARIYVALKTAMKENEADAVAVDCLGLYYSDKLTAYPCLAFFQLNNEGSTGVCEADVRSTLSQLMVRYLTGRPAYVSDPVIDTASDQIVYAHCVATNRVYGKEGLRNPYIIRSHSEDRKGASVESLMPLGETVTTIQVNPDKRLFSIHNGRTVANVHSEKACRTKLAAELDAELVMRNYRFADLGWHRVTFYGDYRNAFVNLATLYGLEVHEEDRPSRE
jgi:L-fucose isomerase-like protein